MASALNKYEYTFLKGDKGMWPAWGAAYAAVMGWCKNKGYGTFGKPTEKGKEVMREYEELHRTTINYDNV